MTPILGQIAEAALMTAHIRDFHPSYFDQKRGRRIVDIDQPYVIDKRPDGKNSMPVPQAAVDALIMKHRRALRWLIFASSALAIAVAYKTYNSGFQPKMLMAAPVIGGLALRFLSAAERFERLKSGRYALVKLPIQLKSEHSPAP